MHFGVDVNMPSADGSSWNLTVTRDAGNTSTITPYVICMTAS